MDGVSSDDHYSIRTKLVTYGTKNFQEIKPKNILL